MTQVVKTKNRKTLSAFQKLWDKAVKHKRCNERLRTDLNEIVGRIRQTVLPREIEIAKSKTPLMIKLLTLGQRKSMTNWERETLDEWISELLRDTHHYGLFDDTLRDHCAHYDAFRMGIQLEDDSLPPHQQFEEIIRQAREEAEAEEQRREENFAEEFEANYREMMDRAEADMEREIKRQLGPRPEQTTGHNFDLFENELDESLSEAQKKWDEDAAQLRKEMERELVGAFGEGLDVPADKLGITNLDDLLAKMVNAFNNDDPFDFGAANSTDWQQEIEDEAPISKNPLTNDTFQQLFRATAAKLHPDREPDPTIRQEKQKLMATLLAARKSGDLITVLELYETWVGEHEGFNKRDEKSLIATLENWLEQLDDEENEITEESSLHWQAYNVYYDRSKKRVNAAFAERLAQLDEVETNIAMLTKTITSLKTLKPYLENRYQQSMWQHIEDMGEPVW